MVPNFYTCFLVFFRGGGLAKFCSPIISWGHGGLLPCIILDPFPQMGGVRANGHNLGRLLLAQTVQGIDPIFLVGTPRGEDHLVLKYKVWGCPLRG